jgi:hypothetical protein
MKPPADRILTATELGEIKRAKQLVAAYLPGVRETVNAGLLQGHDNVLLDVPVSSDASTLFWDDAAAQLVSEMKQAGHINARWFRCSTRGPDKAEIRIRWDGLTNGEVWHAEREARKAQNTDVPA